MDSLFQNYAALNALACPSDSAVTWLINTLGLSWCMSDLQGKDANDLRMRAGVMGVAKLSMEVRHA